MIAMLLNPPKKRGRKRKGRKKKMTKKAIRARRRRGQRKAWAKRRRRGCAKQTRAALGRVVCGSRSRYKQLRKRCGKFGEKTFSRGKPKAWSSWVAAGKRQGARILGRSKASNPGYRYGGKRRRSRRRSRSKRRNYSHWIPAYKNPGWVPQYAQNPGIVKNITSGFNVPTLKSAIIPGFAFFGNGIVSNLAAGAVESTTGFDGLKTGIGSIALRVSTAGLLGWGVYTITKNKSRGLATMKGGLVEAWFKAISEYVLPALNMSGMGDYLTVGDAARARNLGAMPYAEKMIAQPYLPDYAQVTGLDNVGVPSFAQASGLDPYPYGMQGMSDYLTVGDAARARNLGGDLMGLAEASELG